MAEITRQSDVKKAGPGRHHAGRGLYLEVRSVQKENGEQRFYRAWLLIYYVGGKRKFKSLGSAELVTLAQARNKVLTIRAKLLEGTDIEDPPEEPPAEIPSVGEVIKRAIALRTTVAQWRESTIKSREDVVRLHIPDWLKAMPVSEVRRAHLLEILSPVWKKSPRIGGRILQVLSLTFAYAIREGWLDSNPAAWKDNLEFDFPSQQKAAPTQHRKAASVEALRSVMPSLVRGTVSTRATAFGVLTATRVSEFVEARWNEIDMGKATWTIPPERRKDHKAEPFVVPLSRQAQDLLQSLPRTSDWVFPSRGSHLKRNAPLNVAKRHTGATMHGMRSTFRSWCSEENIPFEVAELCLMHAIGNAISKAYQRSDLLAQRREVMQRWADRILPPIDASKNRKPHVKLASSKVSTNDGNPRESRIDASEPTPKQA